MQDAWRAYLELALGLSEASRNQAKKVARDLVGKGGATASQVQSFVDDLLSTSRTNREGLARLVRYEVDRALGAVGLATAEEVSELSTRVQALERQLREPSARPVATNITAAKSPAKKTVAKKTASKKTAARKTAAKKATG